MLTLTTPSALLALLGLLVPLAIHLWNRRPGQEVAVGSLRWLAAGANRRLRNLRLEQVLLLLLRAALLVVLAVAVAGPLWRQPLPPGRGQVLVSPALAGTGTLAAVRPTIDSLRRRGYQLRWLSQGLPTVSAAAWRADSLGQRPDSLLADKQATTGFYWARVRQAADTFAGQPLYVLTPATLRGAEGTHPALPPNLTWQTIPLPAETTWLQAASGTTDSLRLVLGHSTERQTTFRLVRVARPGEGQRLTLPGLPPLRYEMAKTGGRAQLQPLLLTLADSDQAAPAVPVQPAALRVWVYATPAYADDARYLRAALRAASVGLPGPLALTVGPTLPTSANAPDWLFWLSGTPVPAAWRARVRQGLHLWQAAAGPGAPDTTLLAAPELEEAAPVAVWRRTRQPALSNAQNLWTAGRGRAVLTRQAVGQGAFYQLTTRINPTWSELPDSPALPALLLSLLRPTLAGTDLVRLHAYPSRGCSCGSRAARVHRLPTARFAAVAGGNGRPTAGAGALVGAAAGGSHFTFLSMMQRVLSSPKIDLALARQQLAGVGHSYGGRYAAAVLLPTLAAGVLLAVLAHAWPALALAAAAVSVVAIAVWRLWPLRQLGPAAVARRLDRQFAELEDSAGLLLQDPAGLHLLGQLQQERVAQQLARLTATGSALLPFSFRKSFSITGLLLSRAALIAFLPRATRAVVPASVAVHFSPDPARKVAALGPARITKVNLLVTPPAYTRRAAFVPAQASFSARVRWVVTVNRVEKAAPTLEIGKETLRLRPVAGQPKAFFAEQTLAASALYRLRYAGQVSDDYAVEVRPDQAPVVRIQTPKPYTLIAAVGTRPEVAVRATLRDDYGLSHAEMVITVAQGQGEAVKFHEVRRDLSGGLGGQPAQGTLSQLLSLPKLGMTYGDELYFYIQARDTHGQRARSDTYLVQWQDTAAATSALDMGMGVNTAPAYFRSERQIIIDTEKLMAEQGKLTAAEFTNRANALGFDQQSLRLRYGKFLGEEAEKGLGVTAGPSHSPIAEDDDTPAVAAAPTPPAETDDHDHAAPPQKAGSLGSQTAATDALMDPYIHKHDDAETADFLEPAVKAKLQAVLSERWAAELRLRTGQPAAARPYEYRALRLLKEVQQQTRAYVKKAGFTPQPFPEATLRLTGELKGAAVPHLLATVPAPAAQPAVRGALGWLAAAQAGQPSRPADALTLEQAGQALAQVALQKPGVYLPALRALRTLATDARAGRAPCASCLAPAARALTDLLPAPTPTAAAAGAAGRLGQRYFRELNR